MIGGILLEYFCIIINMIDDTIENFDWFSLIKDCIEIISTIFSIWVMIVGLRAINRIHLKSEDAIFGFFSRFSVYLELLREAIGTSDRSILYYKLTEDLQRRVYAKNTPSQNELDYFKKLSKEILDFLKESDSQIAITEDYYDCRKSLISFLIKEGKNLGDNHPYGENSEQVKKDIADVQKTIEHIIKLIDDYNKDIMLSFWKHHKKKSNNAR